MSKPRYLASKKGPHADTDPWLASIGGELPGEAGIYVRVTPNGLVGANVGREDNGTSEPIGTEAALAFIAEAIGRNDQAAA